MAIYNEILVPRFARALQKLMGIKGPVPTKQLAGEIMAVIPLFFGSENRYLEGWDRFAQAFTIAAGGAGNQTVFQIRNPAGSNVIAVIEKILVVGIAADTFVMRQATGQGDLATIVAAVGLDLRGRTSSTCITSSKNNNAAAAPGTSILVGGTTANSNLDVLSTDLHEVPLTPNESYGFGPANLNEGFNISLFWRERFLEEGERS